MSYTEEQITNAFKAFDADNSGFINKSELMEVLKKINVEDVEAVAKVNTLIT